MISVIIPTCRRPELLSRCLDQLKPGVQTLPADQYEVIVTDDGEPTVERLIADHYPWAVWSAGPRRGPAANRNSGARRASGKWLAFTDDDCVPAPGWLAAFAAAIHEDCLVYEGKTTCNAGIFSPLDHAPANITGGYLWSCNMFLRRTTFEDLSGFDEAYPYPFMEDVDFRERLLRTGHRFEFVPSAIVDHPPRRVPPGARLARCQESWVYHWYKSGQQTLCTPRLLAAVLRSRISAIARHQLSLDTFRAAGALTIEIGILIFRLPFWERKYRRRLLRLSPK